MKALQSIQGELALQKRDMKDMEKNIKEAINKNIDEKFSRIETKTNQLEIKIEQQQRSIDFLDRQIRKKNLVFFGVEETERNYEDLLNLILDIINTKMEVLCERWEIETVIRIGKSNGRSRPVVVTISTTSRKLELLRKKKSLENTDIYIKEDYSPAVLQTKGTSGRSETTAGIREKGSSTLRQDSHVRHTKANTPNIYRGNFQ